MWAKAYENRAGALLEGAAQMWTLQSFARLVSGGHAAAWLRGYNDDKDDDHGNFVNE
jgi:hypothetical protein